MFVRYRKRFCASHWHHITPQKLYFFDFYQLFINCKKQYKTLKTGKRLYIVKIKNCLKHHPNGTTDIGFIRLNFAKLYRTGEEAR